MVRGTHARASKASRRFSTSWLVGLAVEGGSGLEAGLLSADECELSGDESRGGECSGDESRGGERSGDESRGSELVPGAESGIRRGVRRRRPLEKQTKQKSACDCESYTIIDMDKDILKEEKPLYKGQLFCSFTSNM